MAFQLIPETGEGIAGANSYLTVEEFQDYADLLGYSYTDMSLEQIERYLIRTAILIDSEFRTRFPGQRKTGQGLEWPRTGAYYYDGEGILSTVVPKEVKMASVEMVYTIHGGQDVQPIIAPEGRLRSERVKVDVIEEEKKYTDGGASLARATYTKVEDAISRITGGISALYDLKVIRVGGEN